VFVAVSGVSILPLLVTTHLPPVHGHVMATNRHGPLQRLKLVFGNRNHLRAYGLASVMMFAGFTVMPFISPYMVANVGVKESELAVLYFFGGGVTLFVQRAMGRMSDLHGKRRVFVAVSGVSILPLLVTTHLPPVPLWGAVLAAMLFMSLISGRFVPAMAIITSAPEPRLRGSFMSFYSSIQQFSAGTAVFLSSMIIGSAPDGQLTHYGTVGWIAVGFTIVAIVLAPRIKSAEVVA
jgi:predicted MFS family arabinose efflux permease